VGAMSNVRDSESGGVALSHLRSASHAVAASIHMTHQASLNLMEVAKDPNSTSSMFVEAARRRPHELSRTDDLGYFSMAAEGHSTPRSPSFDNGPRARSLPSGGSIVSTSSIRVAAQHALSSAAAHLGIGGMEHGLTPVRSSARTVRKSIFFLKQHRACSNAYKIAVHVLQVHEFFSRAHDLDDTSVAALHALDNKCLTRKSTHGRTPIHHLMQTGLLALPALPLLEALHNADHHALVRHDKRGDTPLDRYFRENSGRRNPSPSHPGAAPLDIRDPLLRALCDDKAGIWGLEAIAKCSEVYRSQQTAVRTGPPGAKVRGGSTHGSSGSGFRQTATEMPPQFQVLLTGDLYQVERFVAECMEGGEPEDAVAALKLLFVVLPLRAPTKYGLTSTQGLLLATRVLNAVADVYSSSTGDACQNKRKRWMRAISDAALFMIQDDGMLKGMLTDPPSQSALEALASTELMTTVLHLKFNSGPVMFFLAEFFLFLALGALIVSVILSGGSAFTPAVVGMVLAFYFTARELHHMQQSRAHEMSTMFAEQHAMERQAGRRKSLLNHHEHIRAARPASTARRTAPRSSKVTVKRRMSHTLGLLEGNNDADDESDETEDEAVDTRLCLWAPHISAEGISRFVTVYLGLSSSWRSNAFNWINFFALLGCWITLLNQIASATLSSLRSDYFVRSLPLKIETAVHVVTVFFLWIKGLGYLRGTGIKMATFVLMLQDISWNVDTFLVVLVFILLMFAMLYFILLQGDTEEYDDDQWDSFQTSLWKVWIYSVADVDPGGYPTTSSYFLFTSFALIVIIIMMNILIAIVSDSYTDAMRRSAPLFWRARVDLIAEFEPLLPKFEDDEVVALLDGRFEMAKTNQAQGGPNKYGLDTWQAQCLRWQEGLLATTVVCGLVLVELIVVSRLPEGDSDQGFSALGPRFFWSAGISAIFLFDISLRYYNWRHTAAQLHSSVEADAASTEAAGAVSATIGEDDETDDDAGSEAPVEIPLNGMMGERSSVTTVKQTSNSSSVHFFSNRFRIIDATVAALDVSILVVELSVIFGNATGSKSGIFGATVAKLARLLRFARFSRWLRAFRALRSCRFVAKLGLRWRQSVRPTRATTANEVRLSFAKLDESAAFAGRVVDLPKQVKRELGKSTSHLLHRLEQTSANTTAQIDALLASAGLSTGAGISSGGGSLSDQFDNGRFQTAEVALQCLASKVDAVSATLSAHASKVDAVSETLVMISRHLNLEPPRALAAPAGTTPLPTPPPAPAASPMEAAALIARPGGLSSDAAGDGSLVATAAAAAAVASTAAAAEESYLRESTSTIAGDFIKIANASAAAKRATAETAVDDAAPRPPSTLGAPSAEAPLDAPRRPSAVRNDNDAGPDGDTRVEATMPVQENPLAASSPLLAAPISTPPPDPATAAPPVSPAPPAKRQSTQDEEVRNPYAD